MLLSFFPSESSLYLFRFESNLLYDIKTFLTIKLFIGHLVIQTARDAYFDVLRAVINSYIKLGKFCQTLKERKAIVYKNKNGNSRARVYALGSDM